MNQKHKEENCNRYVFQKHSKVMVPEEGVGKRNETEARREEAKSEGKIGDDQEKEEVDMGEEQKKGKEKEKEEDEECVEER